MGEMAFAVHLQDADEMGHRFAARLRDIKERRLHLFPGQEASALLAGMTAEPIASGHEAAH